MVRFGFFLESEIIGLTIDRYGSAYMFTVRKHPLVTIYPADLEGVLISTAIWQDVYFLFSQMDVSHSYRYELPFNL